MMKSLYPKLLWAMLTGALLAIMASCTAFASEEETHVVILCTSDMHGNIPGYSYEDNAPTENNGMARLYTYIKEVREENPVVFLVDGGDDIQGSIMTDAIANKQPETEHPVMAAMNYMGYDAMTLGNHEFDWGIDTMLQILKQAEFPVLGMNVLNRDGSYVTGQGWTIAERGGVRLGIIGVCTPFIPRWNADKQGIADTVFEPAWSAVQKAAEEIGEQADILLVSAHMGEYAEYDEDTGADSGQKILDRSPEVDLLQVGHMHITVNETYRDIPVFGVRNGGREIARIDLTLDGKGQIQDIATQIVGMEDYEPSEEICEIPRVKELHEQAVALVSGGTDEDGESGEILGSTTAKFQPENEIQGLPEGKLQDTAVIDLILNIELQNSGADVASASLFSDSSDLPEGNVTYRDIFNIYKYDNTLYTVNVTGKELKAYMERIAACYNQWRPGDINISFNEEQPGYLLDMFGGISYEIDLSRPEGERICNILFQGEPLKDDQVLKLAVTNYRYSSLLKAEKLVEGKRDWESSNSIRDMIVACFEKNSPVAPAVDHNWHIVGVDLSREDPRRDEIISRINEGLLPTPYYESYNIEDYDALMAEAAANKENLTVESTATH